MTRWLEAAAITLVFTKGSIFDFVRARGPQWWRTLAGCPLCAGVWIGGAWYAWWTWVYFWPPPDWEIFAAYVLANGCITGILALTVAKIWGALESASAWLDERTEHIRSERESREKSREMAELARQSVSRYSPSQQTKKITLPEHVVARSRRTPDPDEEA